jgi:nitroreductase
MQKDDYKEFDLLLRQRRSVYPENYTGERVADELIWEMLENANWAPTHKLTEPWRFHVFCGEGLKKIFGMMAEIYKESTKPEAFKSAKYEKFFSLPSQVSHLIAIGMKREDAESLPEFEEVAAVACAVQNMMLSATVYGLGSYWSTGGGIQNPKMKTFLELGEKDRCLGFLYVGIPKGNLPEGKRKPIQEKIKWIGQ